MIAISTTFAQIGKGDKYTHFVGGNFNRVGWRPTQDFASFNTTKNNYNNIPKVSFTGGEVSDIAAAGNGLLVVGSFTAMNGQPVGGIAYFDGINWCVMPHLNLFIYDKLILPQPIKYPTNLNVRAGSAAAIYAIGNDYYIFGGNSGIAQARFNRIGNTAVGVAGLVRLKFESGNFTVDTTQLNYETIGSYSNGTFENNGNGFPALSAPVTTLGKTKLRVINTGGVLSFYVHPNVGSNSHLQRWRVGDGAWLAVTATNPLVSFNVSGVPTNFAITANAMTSGCVDFDVDSTNNAIFVCGRFDNTQDINSAARYLHVAKSINAQSGTITWGTAVNWANPNNFNQTGQFASAIAVNNQNQFYVAIPFTVVDTNDNLVGIKQFQIYAVNSGTPQVMGNRFATKTGSDPNIAKLVFQRNTVYAFGNFGLYNYLFDQNNRWPRRYSKKLSGAVRWNATISEWENAYGGFTPLSDTSSALPGVAVVGGSDLIWFSQATAFYDFYSAGGLVTYNSDPKVVNWLGVVYERPTTPGNSDAGGDGNILTVHFIQKQDQSLSADVLIGGTFDWIGNTYFGSLAKLNTSDWTLRNLGGGLYVNEGNGLFSGDQNPPYRKAGTVYDFEQVQTTYYASGLFSKNANGQCLSNIAQLEAKDTVWSSLGAGCDGIVYDMLSHVDKLYVGGEFESCGGIPGTRRIAVWYTDSKKWGALDSGFADGRVYSMVLFLGNLFVGGNFQSSPSALRYATETNPITGLYKWTGKFWDPVFARCTQNCEQTYLDNPFLADDPLARSVSNVKSMRVLSGENLYIMGSIRGQITNSYLLGFDGLLWNQYGTVMNSGCIKQGCISTNYSSKFSRNANLIVLGSRIDSYDSNYQLYDLDDKNYVDTFTGFDVAPVFIASSSVLCFSLFILISILFLYF